jgi:hypothetical protein
MSISKSRYKHKNLWTEQQFCDVEVTLERWHCDGADAELNRRSQDAESNKPMLMQPYDFRLHDIFHVKQHGVIEQMIISIFVNYMILWYETTLITIKFKKHFRNTSVNSFLWDSNILRTKLTSKMNHVKKLFMLFCAKIVDNMIAAVLKSWSSL